MKFSIITPVKNGIKYFEECIKSILSQKGDFHIEYIVVDGGSTDGSIDLVEKYKEGMSNNSFNMNCLGIEIIHICQKDDSMYQALVSGFSICSGDIIAYLNADDVYLPDAFSKVMHCFEDKRVNWLMGQICTCNEHLKIIHQIWPFYYNRSLILKGHYNGKYLPFIQQENVFFRKALLTEIDLARLVNFKLAGDYYLWHSFAKSNEIWLFENSFAMARMHNNRLSNDRIKYYEEFNKIANHKTVLSHCKSGILFVIQHVISNRILNKISKYRIKGH